MCQKWFEKFYAGDFSLDDAPWAGGPIEVDSDQIETLIENSQPISLYYTGDSRHEIPKSITLLAKMKNVSFILWKKLNRLFDQPNNKKKKLLKA